MATTRDIEDDTAKTVSILSHDATPIDTSSNITWSSDMSEYISNTAASTSSASAPTVVLVTHTGELIKESKDGDAPFLTVETKREIIEALQRSGLEDGEVTAVIVEDPNVTNAEPENGEPVDGEIWSQAAVLKLISLHKEFQHLFDIPQLSEKSIWKMISERMQKDGFNYSWTHIQNKWNILTMAYRDAIDCNTLHGLRKSPFFDAMALEYDYVSPHTGGQVEDKSPVASSFPTLKQMLSRPVNAGQSNDMLTKACPSVMTSSTVENDTQSPSGTPKQGIGDLGQRKGEEAGTDMKQLFDLLTALHKDKADQDKEQRKLLESRHQEKMAMFREVLGVLKDVQSTLSHLEQKVTSSKSVNGIIDSKVLKKEVDGGSLENNVIEVSNDIEGASYNKHLDLRNLGEVDESCMVVEKISDQDRNRCDICGELFMKKISLQGHEETHTQEKPYSCDMCSMKLRLSGQLSQHTEADLQGALYTCDVCGKGFKHAQAVIRHRHVHTGHKPHACGECDKRFSRSDDLKSHQRTHAKETLFQCDVCGRGFKYKVNLQRHLSIHSENRQYKHWCDVCGKGFKHAHAVIRHGRIHTGHKPHACGECDKTFSRSDDLKSHQRTHVKERLFQCDVCGKGFKYKVNLKRHLSIHSENRQYKHWCGVCGKGFSTKTHLNEHFLTHTGEKPFACDVCGNRFTSKNLLRRHKFTHADEKPCKCNICGKGFTTNTHMKKHKLKLHGDAKP